MKRIMIFGFLIFAFYDHSFGCSCSFSGPFIKVSKESDLTIVAKITNKGIGILETEIIKVIIGNYKDNLIEILGDRDGNSCNEVLSNYLIGETYAFALRKANNNYFLSACGEYSLKIENGLVLGMIDESFMEDKLASWPKWNTKSMNESEFYEKYSNMVDLKVPPCKAVKNYEPSDQLTMKYNKAIEKFNADSISFNSYESAILDYNLPLVKFYIENANLLNEPRLAELALSAAFDGSIELVKLFISNGVSPNICVDGKYYLMLRSILYPDMLKYLHSSGATLNPRGARGITILMHAAREGCIESINYLIENGADLNEKSDDGKSISYYVGMNSKNQEEVKALLKNKKQ